MTGTPNLNKGTSEAPQDVAALRKLREAGTEGEWRFLEAARGPQIATVAKPLDTLATVKAPRYRALADAALIVAAVNSLPGLLDQNDRLRSALEWALRNNGGECPADYPAGYANALRVLRGSGAEEAARNG